MQTSLPCCCTLPLLSVALRSTSFRLCYSSTNIGEARHVVLQTWSALLCGSSIVHCVEWSLLLSSMCSSLIVWEAAVQKALGHCELCPKLYLLCTCVPLPLLWLAFPPSFTTRLLYKMCIDTSWSSAPLATQSWQKVCSIFFIQFEAFDIFSNDLTCHSWNVSVWLWKST